MNKATRNQRRALLRGVPTERRSRKKIAEAHGWLCALCGGPIPKDAHYLDPLALTLDHIVPLSRGGDDLRSNLQPAHRSCNRAKGNHTEWSAIQAAG